MLLFRWLSALWPEGIKPAFAHQDGVESYPICLRQQEYTSSFPSPVWRRTSRLFDNRSLSRSCMPDLRK